jgi:hypothetical protein
MAPRQRKESNRQLPDNVRERDGYYSWRHPVTKQEYGLGRDRDDAFDQAIEANLELAGEPKVRLIDRIKGAESRTWGGWCDEFEKLLAERTRSKNTERQHGVYLKRARAAFDANRPAASITTLDCAGLLKALKTEGKARTAQAFRSFLTDCFDRMIAQGWRSDNPVRVTDSVTVTVKRARLSLDVFLRLYAATDIIWLRNAMALALVAGKDRDSVRKDQSTGVPAAESAAQRLQDEPGRRGQAVPRDRNRQRVLGPSDTARQGRPARDGDQPYDDDPEVPRRARQAWDRLGRQGATEFP